MEKKGRKTIRDEPKTESVLLRLTKSEKELMKRYAMSKQNNLSEMIIEAFFRDMLVRANYQFSVDQIKSLERVKKWKQPSK